MIAREGEKHGVFLVTFFIKKKVKWCNLRRQKGEEVERRKRRRNLYMHSSKRMHVMNKIR